MRSTELSNRKKLGACAQPLGLAFLACLLVALSATSGHASRNYLASQNYKVVFSTKEELAEDVAQAPCKDSERLNAVKALFVKMGAHQDELLVEKGYRIALALVGELHNLPCDASVSKRL